MIKKFIVGFFVFAFVLAIGVGIGAYFALIEGIPQIEEIKNYKPSEGTKVYADDDVFIGEFRVEKGLYVPIKKIPEHLIKAVVAVEDSRFWVHKGVDYIAIVRAAFKDVLAGGIKEGASTITQQLAKVVFLSPEKTIVRKLKEAILAFRLEKNLSKEEILELYLNRVYFGHRAYGIEMASRRYFGKSVSEIKLPEAALLIGLIKAPNNYSPYSNLDKAKERQYIVFKRMQEEGYITKEQAEEAYKQPLYLASVSQGQDAPNYFLDYVRKYVEEKYGFEAVYKGDLKVYTTMNRKMQITAVKSLQRGLRDLDKRQGFRGVLGHRDIDAEKEMSEKALFKKTIMNPGDILTAAVLSVSPAKAIVKTRGTIGSLFLTDAMWAEKLINSKGNVIKRFKPLKLTDILKAGDIITVGVKDVTSGEPVFMLEQEPLVQGAVVAIEPSTGYIRALVGGYDFGKSEFNRAIYARRQAGSAFKPIIYSAAMDYGFTTASIIMDEPVVYPNRTFGDWAPENYDKKFHGATRLRDALAYSRNIVTIKLLERIGVERAINFAKTLGIKGPFQHNLTLALGSLSVTPIEMASTFSVFAHDGVMMNPIAVKYITDSKGNILENNEPNSAKAISSQTAFLTTSMLEDVVNYGTAKKANVLKRHVAGKTGTTNDFKDAWFIGYTPELTAAVWVGFDDLRQLGNKETGARAALPIWMSFMGETLPAITIDGKGKSFTVPEEIVTAVIDPLTGLLATNTSEKMIEFFKQGTVPSKYSTESGRDLAKKQKEKFKATEDMGDTDID
ncbi:MAG: PBP1A family penicillin-binding protein [Nitrospirae bacterium]|nr:PBP1A family penicillin-binding protein [Nitrospirota bacterium]